MALQVRAGKAGLKYHLRSPAAKSFQQTVHSLWQPAACVWQALRAALCEEQKRMAAASRPSVEILTVSLKRSHALYLCLSSDPVALAAPD